MKNILNSMRFVLAVTLLVPSFVSADAMPGEPAPAFLITDAAGASHTLSHYIGSWLVLEWFNKDCPSVKKLYGSGQMQKLQQKYTDKGVNWLTIISSAEGKQGYLKPGEALNLAENIGLEASAPFLLDPTGVAGRAYGAKTTPYMSVINPHGMVVYDGAINDNDSTNPGLTPDSTNYVSSALDAGLNGEKVETPITQSYGCSVKY